jgi:hypothetical protein
MYEVFKMDNIDYSAIMNLIEENWVNYVEWCGGDESEAQSQLKEIKNEQEFLNFLHL